MDPATNGAESMSYKATNWAYELKLGSPMKPVLVALADMADESGSCYPGQKRLADMTGFSVATVRRALTRLENKGLLRRERRIDQFGHRTSDRYFLQLTVTLPESLPLTVPSRQSAQKAESPSLTLTQSIPTAHSEHGTTSYPSVEPSGARPSATCGKHPNGTTKKCMACGDARRAHDAWKQSKRDSETYVPTLADQGLCKHAVPADGCWQCEEAMTG